MGWITWRKVVFRERGFLIMKFGLGGGRDESPMWQGEGVEMLGTGDEGKWEGLKELVRTSCG